MFQRIPAILDLFSVMAPEVVRQLLAVIHVELCVGHFDPVEVFDGVFGVIGAGVVDESVLGDDGDLEDSADPVEGVAQIFHGDRQADVAHVHGEHRGRGHPGWRD